MGTITQDHAGAGRSFAPGYTFHGYALAGEGGDGFAQVLGALAQAIAGERALGYACFMGLGLHVQRKRWLPLVALLLVGPWQRRARAVGDGPTSYWTQLVGGAVPEALP